jgi:alpha-ketoglutarate-dependent taurine dioxygenase
MTQAQMASASASATTVKIVPVAATFAARVLGTCADATWTAIKQATLRRAFMDHHVLVFTAASPGAIMDPAATRTLASHFGEPIAEVSRDKRGGGLPHVSLLDSTIKAGEEGKDPQFHYQPGTRSTDWHTDQSFLEIPAKATVLHAHEVPSHSRVRGPTRSDASAPGRPTSRTRL